MFSAEPQDPGALLPYRIDWTGWLDGAEIANSVWTIPDGLVSSDESNTGTAVVVYIAIVGPVGTRYIITNRVTTNETPPRIDERSIVFVVQQR